jgi:AraC-like DNA-binding protein
MYLTLVILLVVLKSYLLEIDYFSLLITSVLIFVIGYASLRNPVILFELNEKENLKYSWSEIDSDKMYQIKSSLEKIMSESKPFFNSELRLPELAKLINITPQILSQIINTQFGQNFYDYINTYRVNEAKILLLDKKYDNKTILSIAYDVGFSSKATFNRAFKKQTGLTPTEYKSRQ